MADIQQEEFALHSERVGDATAFEANGVEPLVIEGRKVVIRYAHGIF